MTTASLACELSWCLRRCCQTCTCDAIEARGSEQPHRVLIMSSGWTTRASTKPATPPAETYAEAAGIEVVSAEEGKNENLGNIPQFQRAIGEKKN